jgi:hypothetical protein
VASSTSRDFFLDWIAVRAHAGTPAPPALSAVGVSPASVVGGNSATGTLTLTSAAPAGGAAVSLSTSDAAVDVPASATIAAGATSVTFAASTSVVTANTPVTITATYDGTVRTATLTVTPEPPAASLQNLAVSPTSVTGGATAQGTVTLSSSAPAGGAVVALSSSDGAASVPTSVTIQGGSASATFTASTSSVTASTPVTITATYGGVTRTATLTVNPQSQASTATLTVTATGRSGQTVSSNPAGITANVGGSDSGSFAIGTSITLSVSNGRDAIWSGACSSGGNKRRTCTFTLNGTASVTANVQ